MSHCLTTKTSTRERRHTHTIPASSGRSQGPRQNLATPTSVHLKHLYRLINYVIHTSEVGNYIKSNVTWDGKNKDMEFTISGRSGVEYASDPETWRSVSGGTVFFVALSFTPSLG
jgi:hypothetical protein